MRTSENPHKQQPGLRIEPDALLLCYSVQILIQENPCVSPLDMPCMRAITTANHGLCFISIRSFSGILDEHHIFFLHQFTPYRLAQLK